MTARPGVWKRRKAVGKNAGSDISHFYPDLQKHDTWSACNKSWAARSDLTDEIKGITKRCMLCQAKERGYGLLVGLRKEWDRQ